MILKKVQQREGEKEGVRNVMTGLDDRRLGVRNVWKKRSDRENRE